MADQGCVDKGVLKCPRCGSTNTEFSYYQNGNKSQPRYLCSGCQRSWTVGGSLRDVPIRDPSCMVKADQGRIGEALECPRCGSTKTKFSYYQNQNKSQPRYSCSSCQRSWTVGGILRDVPVGGGKSKRLKCPRSEISFGDQVRNASVELMCPRCHSTNTKFSYDGDQKDSQLHHSCNNCQRCWTRDITLMAIPVGGDEKSIKEKKMRKFSKKKRVNGDSSKKKPKRVPVGEERTPKKRN